MINTGLSIAIDIGTTGCRTELFDAAGKIIAKESVEYTLHVPQSGWAEQDPEEIYAAVMECLRRLPTDGVDALVMSSVFHSFIPLNRAGQPLTKMWIWADNRAVEYANRIKKALPGLYERTACPCHPMYLPAKIAWFKDNRHQAYRETRHIASIKEYVLFRWFKRYVVDKSIASGSGLYNFKTLSWDQELLRFLELDPSILSEVVDTDYQFTVTEASPLREVGIKQGLPLVIGAGDGVLSSLGTGAVRKGQLTAMIGTSGAVRILSPLPKTDIKGRTWCYNLSKDWWVLGGAINNGGLAYRWVRDNLMGMDVAEAPVSSESYERINEKAWEIPPGAEGVIFLPYLTGERSPYWNANARGVLFGLGLNHSRYHIARATVEGVVFRMYSVFQALEDLGGPVAEVRLTGGVAGSRLWVQTVADVFQREVLLPENHGSGLGAWILLQHAQGKLKSLLDAEHLAGVMEKHQPRAEYAGLYQELYDLYNRIYEKLQGEFFQIARLQRTMNSYRNGGK
ncbi:MAG: gluconokinase [Desulfitobacteriaceae bacterium]|nr:gluconokinase [Desulfitobacteriaceae bacterium]MDI6877863.1 gluconokinase [Desulfitobacteriaceae bacterium]MDI6912736.1 gluconokinase [Desulfitobacteriaceae bacterium]